MTLVDIQLSVNHIHPSNGRLFPCVHGVVLNDDKWRLGPLSRGGIEWVTRTSRQHTNDSEYSHTFSQKDGVAILVRGDRKVHPHPELY